VRDTTIETRELAHGGPRSVSEMSRRGWVLFTALSIIWGVPYLLIRIAVRDVSPATLVFFRTGVAGLAFVPFIVGRDSLRAIARRWVPLVAYTIIEVSVPWLLLSRAEQRLTSSLAGLLIATVPLIAVVISWATRHEGALGWRRLVGLGIGLAGVAVIVGVDIHGPDVFAVVEVLGVSICYALGPFVVDRYLTDVPAVSVVGASLFLSGVGYAPFGLTHLPAHLSPEEIASIVILIVVCTAIAFLIYFALIAEVGPARATVITYINPAVAVVLGIVILHEHFSTGLAVGVPLVLVGSFLGTGGNEPPIEGHRPAERAGQSMDAPRATRESETPVHDVQPHVARARVIEGLRNGGEHLEAE
jgi:drug/metabolite transporter (DMT)-like permease